MGRTRRSGYKYSYNLRVDDEIIPEYYALLCDLAFTGSKSFLFDFRTNFRLQTTVDNGCDEIKTMGSERFGVALQEFRDEKWLKIHTNFRLRDDYWMSDDEITPMLRKALDLAKAQKAAAAVAAVIPVVVDLDVWTVQEEGESIGAAMDRAINVDNLMPILLWPEMVPKGSRVRMKFNTNNHNDSLGHLRNLSRFRVEDEAGLARAKTCKICSRDPVIGAQISFLDCGHSFHSRCVFDWIQEGYFMCPMCQFRI